LVRNEQEKVRSGMKEFLRSLAIVILLGSCAAVPPAPVRTAGPPPGFPSNLRWDLVPKWIQWTPPATTISWPPADGCGNSPVAEKLPVGAVIDRFGSDHGSFFSPAGASFAARATPYVCKQMDYTVYQVLKPTPVDTCKAAPWFDEPGGAQQMKSGEPAEQLVTGRFIRVVSHVAGGGSGPFPQCGGP
jgi:hypothetical protein